MSLRSLFFRKKTPPDKDLFIKERAPIRGLSCSKEYSFTEKNTGKHIYLEKGNGRAIIFCPGLYGGIHNIAAIGAELSKQYRFIMPFMPMYDVPLSDCKVQKLADYLDSFMKDLNIIEAVFIGSSMGGGTLLHYALKEDHAIRGLVLCGSSGLSAIPMQKGFFKRKEFAFVKQATQDIFYDPTIPSDAMIREVFDAMQKVDIVLRSIRFTKATGKDQLHDQLSAVKPPCLLVWGKQDPITPPEVARLFKDLLPNAELQYVDHCGHVPTQEQPVEVLRLINAFLQKINYT